MSILSQLLAVLILIESGGNPLAVGDGGRARGALQIHSCVVEDVNRFDHTHYTWDDAFSLLKSQDIFLRYVRHYATRERLGHEPTAEDVARIWNGGPNGYLKPSTLKYWRRVERRLY